MVTDIWSVCNNISVGRLPFTVDLLDSNAVIRMENCLWVPTQEEPSIAMHRLEMWLISYCTNTMTSVLTGTAVVEMLACTHVVCTTREDLQAEEKLAPDHLQVNVIGKIILLLRPY